VAGVRTKGIDHYVLHVADAERSVAWYGEVLGLQPERLDEWRDQKVLFVSLRVDPTTIIDLLQTPRTGENVNHVAFVVEDVDLDELAASGTVEVDSGPADLWGAQGQGRGLYIRDPDGNLVELRTY
jgi:catechol 2,3-dioxygenase-like lactoylglutathione lyase family enzyme